MVKGEGVEIRMVLLFGGLEDRRERDFVGIRENGVWGR